MTIKEAAAIARSRLGRWAVQMAKFKATPIVCVWIGHDEILGQLHLSIPQDIPIAKVELLLIGVLAGIKEHREQAGKAMEGN